MDQVPPQRRGHGAVKGSVALAEVSRVTGERLISALAGEHHRHMLARQLTHRVHGQGGGGCDGLVEMPDRLVEKIAVLTAGEDDLFVDGSKPPRRRPGLV